MKVAQLDVRPINRVAISRVTFHITLKKKFTMYQGKISTMTQR